MEKSLDISRKKIRVGAGPRVRGAGEFTFLSDAVDVGAKLSILCRNS